MNHCCIQHSSFISCEERKKVAVVCPMPRKLSLMDATLVEPSLTRHPRWLVSYQQEIGDAKAGNELIDITLPKVGYDAEQSITQIANSPLFFSGSPPCRVSNPLIQDSVFVDENFNPFFPRNIPNPSGVVTPSSTRSGTNFGSNPSIRIEGFECLRRERDSQSIPALA